MGEVVYTLCALTSAACAALLWRSFRRHRVRLLLFSTVCFVGLAMNNAMLFVDLVVVPDVDLALVRHTTSLVSLGALLFGLIWDGR